MKKIFKSISASVTAFIIASTMVVSASAASSADVVSAAKSAGVPSNHVSELRTTLILTLQSSALLTMITW